MAAPMHNAFVGSETGLLKGIEVAKGSWRNLNEIQTPTKSNEITCLCWNNIIESEISVGVRSQHVAKYDVKLQTWREFEPYELDSKAVLKSISREDNVFILGYDTGVVTVWSDEETSIRHKITTGTHLQSMVKHGDVIGTGGKENDLKVWDLNNPDVATFQAKNVRNDWLNLRVPVWITGIQFLANEQIVTSTGHHQVRVYDTKVQRRPVLDMTFDEYPITAMSACSDVQVVVGNTQGSMALLDIRKGKLIHRFKGFAGAIRAIQCHASQPVVASCGLDRFFRVHDLNSKEMLYKIYLKSRLNCMLLSKRDWNNASVDAESTGIEEIVVNDDNVEDDLDDVWDQMEVVKTRTLKRKDLTQVEEAGAKVKKVERRTTRKSKKTI